MTILISVCLFLLVVLIFRATGLWIGIDYLIRRTNKLMAKVQDLQDSLDHITQLVDALPAMFTGLKDTIQALRDQIAAGTPVSQAQLDALETEAQAIEDSLTAVEA